MDTFIFFMVSLACVLSVIILWLLVSSFSLRKKNQTLHQHLTIAESELVRSKESLHHFEKKLAKNQEALNFNHAHQNELFDLRRDNSRMKDDIKKYKDDLRIKDVDFKRLEVLHIDKLFLLTKEKDTLLAQIKEMDLSYKSKLDELQNALSQFQLREKNFEEQTFVLEKQNKSNISKVISLQSKLKIAEQEIDSLKNELQSKSNSVAPELVARWRDRAICARNMYRLMRQMRELSDNKVETYQEAVIAISEWVLKQTHTRLPEIAEKENKADRLLAEAWSTVLSTSVPVQNASFSQNLETRM